MPTLDLSGADLDRVRRLVSRYAPDAEVWAYGSRVDGSNHAASDLDLVLRNPIDLSHPQARLFDLREAIAESAIPILVDVLDWARLPRSCYAEIERQYVVIQAGKADCLAGRSSTAKGEKRKT